MAFIDMLPWLFVAFGALPFILLAGGLVILFIYDLWQWVKGGDKE